MDEMGKWSYYRIKTSVLDKQPDGSIIGLLAEELDCLEEDIEYVGETMCREKHAKG